MADQLRKPDLSYLALTGTASLAEELDSACSAPKDELERPCVSNRFCTTTVWAAKWTEMLHAPFPSPCSQNAGAAARWS